MVTYPNDWKKSQLLDHVDLVQGLTYTPENVKPYGTLVLRSSNIQNGRLSLNDNVYVNVHVPEEKMVQPGDILVCVRNGSSALIGKSCVLPKLNHTTFGAFMSVLRGDATGYFAKVFESNIVQEQVRGRSNATINQITKKDFHSIMVTVPSEPEQEEIARTLSYFDTYIDDLSELIEKKRGIRDGALEELLSGKKRLEGFSGIWEEIPLRSVLREKIKIGPFGSQLKKETLVKSGKYKVYGQENIYKRNFLIGNRFLSQAHFDRLSTCEIKGGDFLMSTMGTIGKCAIAPMNLQRGIMDSHLIRFRLNESKLLPLYLLHLFSDNYTYLSNQTTKLAVGGIMDGLSVGIAKQLTVLMPKDLREQNAIANVLTTMDEEIEALESERDKMIQIRVGAMDDLLTGRVRLSI